MISRFGLYEGTWYKYHNVQGADYNKFLDASIMASEELMTAYPDIDDNYDASFNTEDGSSVKGMILYKEFATDLIMHNTMQYLRSDASAIEATKQGVNMFLMQNGKPVHHPDNIGIFSDKTMFEEFKIATIVCILILFLHMWQNWAIRRQLGHMRMRKQ